MKLRPAPTIVAGFLLALLLLAGVAAISFRSTMRMTADAERVEHSHEVMAVIEKLVKTVSYDAVSHRGFLITGDESFLAKHPQTILDRDTAMEQLKTLIADNPFQRQHLTALAAGIAEREQLAKNHVELRRKEGFERVQKNVASRRGERMLERIYTVALEMSAHERTLLNERVKQSESSALATRRAIAGASVMAFSLVGGALWRLNRELAERRKSDVALRQSEERFRALITAISDVVYRMGPNWSEMSQLQSLEFLAPPEGNRNWLQDYIHPDDQPQVMAAIRDSIRTKSTFQLEHRVLQADGTVGWTISRAVPIQDSNGEIVEWFGAASDITPRKRAEQALRENEELLRFAMETEQTGLWLMDVATGAASRSLRHDQIFGYETLLPEWSYEDFLAHILPEDRETVNRTVDHGMATRHGWDFECRIRRHDGMVRWIRVCGRELGNGPGPPVKFAGVVRDITQQKLADEQAHRNEQFKAAVLDSIPAEIALLDRSGTILTVNEPWLRFGRDNGSATTRPAALGTNYLEVAAASARSGDASAGEALAGIEAVLSARIEEFYLEYPCDSPTEKRWFLMHAVAAPAEVGGAIIAHTDITRRKLAEQALAARTAELETVMREVPVAIFIGHGAGSEFITANPTGRKLLRVGEPTNISMSSPDIDYQIFRDGRPLTPAELPMQLAAATGQAVLDSELEVVFTDGGSCRILGNAVPLFDENGAVSGSLGTFIDITERKAAEEALRDFNTKLAESVVERTKELRSTVHILENEISVRRRLEGEILKLSEREQTRLGQDLHDDLGQQLAGIGMLSEILWNQLRNESHPRASDAEQIVRCLTQSISTTRNLAKSFYPVELERGGLIIALQDLALRTRLLSKIRCDVNADDDFRLEKPSEIHLYRIVQESINNAIKHGKATHIQIKCVKESGLWSLTVTNNGKGFTAPEPGKETGMGLHIFQYRAALIGAEISVRRGTPDGCVVTCSIPVSKA
ncbi:MAG: PAS domain S-box protein [Verrucomicrobiota bacterium]